MKLYIYAAMLCLLTNLSAGILHAQAVVRFRGQVETGSLDELDLAGTDFEYLGVIQDPTDIDDVCCTNEPLGTFVIDAASLDFGPKGWFEFDAEPDYFYLGSDGNVYYAAVALEVDVPSTTYTDGFGYFFEPAMAGFDVSQLNQLGPFEVRDPETYTETIEQPFLATDSVGSSLVLDKLALSGELLVLTEAAGDANVDGVFDSRDLVQVFVAGEYQDGIAENSHWTEGDWDSDGDFTSSDLVVAFEAGQYEAENRPATIPEPTGTTLTVCGFLGLFGWQRRRRSV